MKQTNWTQIFNKKSTNTLLLLRNCASKNLLKTLCKVNAQKKSLNKGVFVRTLCTLSIKHLGPICLLDIFLLHDANEAVEGLGTI